jgi:hypothetical protein
MFDSLGRLSRADAATAGGQSFESVRLRTIFIRVGTTRGGMHFL